MTGTILCGAVDTPEGRAAVQLAAALAERLDLRLVLAHVVDVPAATEESVTARQGLSGAERALAGLAAEVAGGAECRVMIGRPAERLAQLAAEEGADLLVLGSRPAGLRGRNLRCNLARRLEAATPAPVLVAPPQSRPRSVRRLAVPVAAG